MKITSHLESRYGLTLCCVK